MLRHTTEHVLISLKPNLIDAFLAGHKCVELRRRAPRLQAGTLVWFYGKVPCGRVMAVGRLQQVTVAPTVEIWRDFEPCIGISKSEFDAYLHGLSEAAVLSFASIEAVSCPADLEELRRIEPGFQPPQFFRRVKSVELVDRLMEGKREELRAGCVH